MTIEYLRVYSSAPALAGALNALDDHNYVQIRLKHISDVAYFGFRLKQDLTLLKDFAKFRGYPTQEMTEDRIRQMHLAPTGVVISGNLSLACRIGLGAQ